MTTYSVIGQPVTQAEGPDKVSGLAMYAADIDRPGMLWGKVLRSPYPHARIVSIDTAKARQMPGVHAVVTGSDLPDSRVGRLLRDHPVLARDKVLFVGDKVAAVAAESPALAEEALLQIDVVYEELPAVFDPEEAMIASAPVLHENLSSYRGLPQPPSDINNVLAHNSWNKGDFEQGFQESDLIFEHSFTTQLAHQGYIEPHACVVEIDGAGRVQIWANNKGPFMLRDQLAAVWGLSKEQIRINPCSIGGDFGGKGSFMDVPLCYYLALHSGRPVKMVMDYIQEFMAGNPRHPGIITLKTGVKKDGRLWARQARVVFNSGAFGAFKPRVHLRGADHSGGPYRIPHVQIDSYMVYTNNIPCGHMRAPAKPQVAFAVESHMDMVAKELGLNPFEFRRINALQLGDASPTGEEWYNIRAGETLQKAADAVGWQTPKSKPNLGRGFAMCDQPQGSGQSSARVAMDEAGKVTLLMSLWDTGTSAHTIMRQIVAESLTIPVEDVTLVVGNTDAVDFESGPGGTRVTYTAGQAALGAANDLREKLTVLAAEYMNDSADALSLRAGRFVSRGASGRSVSVSEVASRSVDATQQPVSGRGDYTSPPTEETSYCTQAAEVEVDPETGQVTVNKIVTVHDVGTVLNPLAHQGQIEGGVIQGLGYALMEEMLTEEGRVSTLSMGDYKMPCMQDIPELVTVLLEPSTGPAPFQSKGIGESSNTPVAGAIANAVYDAVGVRIMDLPITAEKVLKALREKGQG
ncbi:MAG: xanthine dehydrogenase family protein molybdopterin-binding subunit [Chloroflexi bacterium]|nr:xanthine dehydrogenase family protein molybdopterin-binding subunit [Chloroflexota bacterium]MDA1218501.1 xanthine dehydrogenase family protein molybdopterin-binding subunit [Chloroflexota bacterium]